ncbi:MAG: hypothetical protein KatS3mg024_2600 [Armatimonadota bacterium]|nr:MAG: hypothetical protein KatS3mg024_2600 [Armatimonadota bacterium]GIV82639.1 MAG: hypothetical protein KatS3mg051_1993 [Anaerolineae bacterium]
MNEMRSLYAWIGTMLATCCFAVTLFVCVSGGQDLLISVLKSIAVFFAVRYVAGVFGGLVLSLEQGSRSETPAPGEDAG